MHTYTVCAWWYWYIEVLVRDGLSRKGSEVLCGFDAFMLDRRVETRTMKGGLSNPRHEDMGMS